MDLRISGKTYSSCRQALTTLLCVGLFFHALSAAAVGTAFVWGSTTDGKTNVPPAATNLLAIGAGYDHTLALRADGAVFSWGNNSSGQTNVLVTATNIVQIGPGSHHNLVLRGDGALMSWGNNSFGQTAIVPGATNMGLLAAAGGASHSSVLRTNGTVFSWGYNGFGVSNPPPAAYNVMRISAANKSPNSGGHTLALRRDGVIVSWGESGNGQTNAPASASNMVAVAAGQQYSIGLRADGKVFAWGNNTFGKTTVPAEATNVVAIAAGTSHAYALRNDGSLVSWGDTASGKRTPPALVTNSTVIAITAGNLHTACLVSDGSPVFVDSLGSLIAYSNRMFTLNALAVGAPPLSYQWQFNGTDLLNATNGTLTLSAVQANDAGAYSVMVSNAVGVISGLVANVSVEITPELPSIVTPPQSQAVFVGTNVGFTIAAIGYPLPTYQWQFNGTNISGATNASHAISYVVTNQAGSYRVVLSNSVGVVTSAVATLAVNLPDWPVFNAWPPSRGISYGSPLSLSVPALGAGPITYSWTLNGTKLPHVGGSKLTFGAFNVPDSGVYRVYATNAFGWSASPEFQLAAVPVAVWGNTPLTNLPVSLSNTVALGAGVAHAVALRADGQLIGWGTNTVVFFGFPSTTNTWGMATVPPGLSNVVAFSAGSYHTLALRSNGTVVAWGRHTGGETNVPASATNVIAVAAGDQHSLALRGDGTVVAWGTNTSGQTSVPPTATNVVALAAGNTFSVALRGDGQLVTWGSFSGSVASATNIVAISARGGYIVAVRQDGSRFIAGSNIPSSQPLSPPLGSGVDTFFPNFYGAAAGYSHTLYLNWLATATVGALYGSSLSPIDPRLATPTMLNNIVAVAAGDYSFALMQPPGGLLETQTAYRSAPIGGSAVFSTHVEGRRVLNAVRAGTYQWRFNGAAILGATNFFYVRSDLTTEHEGDYSVVVADAIAGTATSQVAHLSVIVPPMPQIAIQPQSRTLGAGTNVTFSIVAAHGIPAQFQWQFNGTDLPGATSSSLILSNLQSTSAGDYRVILTNYSGAITSQVATLTITGAPPVFVVQPQNQIVATGFSTTFSALATGSAPIAYQWLFDGTVIPGATASSLLITNASQSAVGNYRVTATNSNGSNISAQVSLTLIPIAAWGNAASAIPASATNLIAIAAGARNAMALRSDGTVVTWGEYICAATPVDLTRVVRMAAGDLHSLILRDDGTLTIWGDNTAGQLNAPAGLSNLVEIAAGTMHSLALGADGTVSAWGGDFRGEANVPAGLSNVVAVGAGGMNSLALRRDGTVIGWGALNYVPPQATNVTAIAVGFGHAVALRGDGSVIAWGSTSTNPGLNVSLWCGSYSVGGSLSVKTNLIAVPPAATNIVAIAAGRHHILALRADGIVMAWGDDSFGQSSVPAQAHVIGIAAGGYQSFALVGGFAPQLGGARTNRAAGEGSDVLLHTAAGGLPPLSWTWRMNGTNSIGTNAPFLRFPNLLTNDAATYEYVVSNPHGAITGAVSLLATALPPSFVTQPAGAFVGLGSDVTFNPDVRGSLPMTFQWRLNGTNLTDGGNINGVNSATLTITDAQFSDAGNYSVAVTNHASFAISSNATLEVFAESALAAALDTTNLVWTVGGPSGWHWQTGTKHDGVDAAETGSFLTDQTNWLETVIEGPATVSFWWRAIGWVPDRASFSVDGIERIAVANDFEWQQRSYTLPVGLHTLRWTYVCQPFAGSSTAWLDEVTLTNAIAPVVTTHPTTRTLTEGSSTTFSAAASGTEPLAYQWQFNGTNLPNATNASLTLSGLKPEHAGSYQFFTTNTAGFATSQVAVLTVNDSMPVVSLSGSAWLTAAPGTAVTLTSTIFGSAPFHVQWQRNRADIPSANSATLLLTNLQSTQAGLYRVVASNGLGTASSTDVRLTLVSVATWGLSGNVRVPETVGDVVGIAAGTAHSTALRRDGTIMQWGATIPPVLSPMAYLTSSDILSTHAGIGNHNIGIRTNGTVVVFNYVGNGLKAVPAELSNVVAVATSGSHDLALKADGTVVAWGSNASGQSNIPPGATNLIAIAAGNDFSLGITDEGKLIGWGTNNYGQLNLPEGDFVAVAAAGSHAFALRADGTVAAWGPNSSGQTNLPPGLTNIVAIASGSSHGLALRGDGKVFGWGLNNYGQATVWDTLTNVVAIAGGSSHSLAVVGDGRPVVTVPPLRRRLEPGGSSTLRVFATGAGPLQYQWQHNSTNIPGATNATIIASAAGNYSVTVSNHLGAVTPPETAVVPGVTGLRFDSAPGAMALAADGLHLRLLGLSGRGPVVVFASTDFTTWTSILTNPPMTGTLIVVDGAATNLTQRFYRAMEMEVPPLLAMRIHAPSWLPTSTGTLFRATLTGLAGTGPVAILGSTNLSDWTVIASNSPVAGEWQFHHLHTTVPAFYWYRAMEQR